MIGRLDPEAHDGDWCLRSWRGRSPRMNDAMEISAVRKRIIDALERGRRDAAERRARKTEATESYERFLATVAVPICRQVAGVLNAEGHPVVVHTPESTVRLSVERAPSDYVELSLDATGRTPQVMGRIFRVRGRDTVSEERPVGEGVAIAELSEDDVLDLLAEAIPFLVGR